MSGECMYSWVHGYWAGVASVLLLVAALWLRSGLAQTKDVTPKGREHMTTPNKGKLADFSLDKEQYAREFAKTEERR